ncbi:MAG: hypothetical protein V2B18_07285, partial [Pseudomonadota bacterium]
SKNSTVNTREESIGTSSFRPDKARDLVSAEPVLNAVGRRPLDPSKALFAALEKPSVTGPTVEDQTCPPISTRRDNSDVAVSERSGEEEDGKTSDAEQDRLPDRTDGHASPAAPESGEALAGPAPDKPTDHGGDAGRSDGIADNEARGQIPPADESRMAKAARSLKTGTGSAAREGDAGAVAALVPEASPTTSDAQNKPEKYQLPGSLVVNLKNYSGTTVKWAIMAILDDSNLMAKDVKPWAPDRLHAASRFIGKLSDIMTPGSKIAIRDFYCAKGSGSDKNDKDKPQTCPSRLLSEWLVHPFKGFKDKLDKVGPGGSNNPCAAVLYSLKKDFGGIGSDFASRILLVTAGSHACSGKDILKAVEEAGLKGKVKIDLLGVGIGKKNRPAYTKLSAKTEGTVLMALKPEDLDGSVARYEKVLKAPVFKKIEVRGKDGVFFVGGGEEITLAPGTYSLTLPAIPGLQPAGRQIRDVKIQSGGNHVMSVVVKKGRPVVTADKK